MIQTLTSGPLDLSLDSSDVFRPNEGALPCRRLFGICSCLEVLGARREGEGKTLMSIYPILRQSPLHLSSVVILSSQWKDYRKILPQI